MQQEWEKRAKGGMCCANVTGMEKNLRFYSIFWETKEKEKEKKKHHVVSVTTFIHRWRFRNIIQILSKVKLLKQCLCTMCVKCVEFFSWSTSTPIYGGIQTIQTNACEYNEIQAQQLKPASASWTKTNTLTPLNLSCLTLGVYEQQCRHSTLWLSLSFV